jgi:hypothetical protein
MSSSVTNNNKNEIFPSNGENINNFLTADCMLHVFRSSDKLPKTLVRVCKAWHQVLEHSYPWIANFYREDEHITPLYSPVMTAGGQVDTKETVKQTYFRIMKFIDAPRIQKALQQELGPQVVTPLTPHLSPILNVARDTYLVVFFDCVLKSLLENENSEFQQHAKNTFSNACAAAHVPPGAFEAGRLNASPKGVAPMEGVSLVDRALCIHLFVQGWIKGPPKLLTQESLTLNFLCESIFVVPPEICLFSNIACLVLSNNCLSSLPEAFGQLSKLKILHLNNNRFDAFPETLCSLKALTVLMLQNNKLTKLPETFCLLDNLEYLNLRNNRLAKLPVGISKLINLYSLNIKQNNIDDTELHAISKQLSQLHHFDIQPFNTSHNINPEKESTSPSQ